MDLNFLTSQQGLQKSLVVPSSRDEVKNDYGPNLKRDAFKTKNTSENQARQSEQNEKFADMMDALKKRVNAQNKSQAQNTRGKADETEGLESRIVLQDVELSVFQTEKSALPAPINVVESSLEGQVDFANIAALNAEIQRLLDESVPKETSEHQISVILDETKGDKKIESSYTQRRKHI